MDSNRVATRERQGEPNAYAHTQGLSHTCASNSASFCGLVHLALDVFVGEHTYTTHTHTHTHTHTERKIPTRTQRNTHTHTNAHPQTPTCASSSASFCALSTSRLISSLASSCGAVWFWCACMCVCVRFFWTVPFDVLHTSQNQNLENLA